MKKKLVREESREKERLSFKFPNLQSEEEKVEMRREVLERLTGVSLSRLGMGLESIKEAKGKNIENAIGCVQVPLGVVGPLRLCSHSTGSTSSGQAKKRIEYFIPLATTEGALVASVNRGCKAITMSGGVRVWVKDIGITRAPVFKLANIQEAKDFVEWIADDKKKLEEICEKSSEHLELLDFFSKIVGRNVFIRFRFKTDEAMGMNMATIATDEMVRFIEKKTKVKCLSLSSNFCSDKKAAAVNNILGRGKEVWAEAEITDSVLRQVLKTDSKRMVDVGYRKLMLGSAVSGSMGFNAHFANVVAAVYLATGQDMAQVVEGSMGITTIEEDRKGIYVSVYMPSLITGTVGGGTHLPDQKIALKLIGVGEGKSGEALKLAEIVGGTVLAGEVSLLASLAEGSLAKAHRKLGQAGKSKDK